MSIYLDCAASTPVDGRVKEEMLRWLGEECGNAGSRTHDFGNRAKRAVERARDQVASVVKSGRGDVVFTSGATESNNLAILGIAEHGVRANRRHVVGTQIEHSAVLEPLGELRRRGFEVTLVPPTEGGWVDAEAVAGAVRPDTLLVSVMHVNNETGVVQPVEEIARLLDGHEAYFHVDGSQGFGKEIAPLQDPRIDLISVSGHKIYGPKGVGALVTRKRGSTRPPLAALMFGGGQERGLRPGTIPVALVVGLGLAAELAMNEHAERNEKCRTFRGRLLEALAPLSPVFHGDATRVLPQILNLSIPGVDGEEAMEALGDVVALSNGSACTSQSEHCSHVLGAMRMPPGQAEGALRWSWCHETPEPDWGNVVGVLKGLQGGCVAGR